MYCQVDREACCSLAVSILIIIIIIMLLLLFRNLFVTVDAPARFHVQCIGKIMKRLCTNL